MTGVGISDATGKSIKIPDILSRPADLTLFTFRSNILARSVNIRDPNES